uniref:Immunoglobulin domain-containing protein n=1 Tax=Oncorhynchus tshawytscha TaxID=74940 RepID=A0A8C8HK26_ONCTS
IKQLVVCLYSLFICRRGADGLTETLVELGQNTTINCSLNIESAYWYIQHQPQPPQAILHSFTSRSPAAFYYNTTFRQKYSLETGHRLLIHNVTVDDCGVYYCAKKEDQSLLFSNGTRLMTAGKCTFHSMMNMYGVQICMVYRYVWCTDMYGVHMSYLLGMFPIMENSVFQF